MPATSLILLLVLVPASYGTTSPLPTFMTYNHTVELQPNVADLWWTVNETSQTIVFELHMNTTGWIALGISLTGGMTNADIALGWVSSAGQVFLQDRYATGNYEPMIDNTTADWMALGGREQDGWTAIQFMRLLDTCDPMDVAITSGTNHLIFAYGLVDPSLCPPITDITYHETRRGLLTLSLRAYSDPPLQSKYAAYDFFEFRLNNYTVPGTDDTTYYCKIFKAPASYVTKKHVVAHQMMIDSGNRDLVHHVLMYECDPRTQFNDSNLPQGLCDDIDSQIIPCLVSIATGWAVGGDDMAEFPPEAGYPVGGNFSVRYYLVQTHYNNPQLTANRMDSSGIRFYVTDQLRQYDIGYLTFGTDPSPTSITIPPQVQEFFIDSYCPMNASQSFPATGITLLSAFPHTHLQGTTIWTKLIRNKTAVQYLYDAESYDFNYQFDNKLPQRIQLYPGDEFATRCVYNTMNKQVVTVGGERTSNEMCLHMFTYYPRMELVHACLSYNYNVSWQSVLTNSSINDSNYDTLITNVSWTPALAAQWQDLYNNAQRQVLVGGGYNLRLVPLNGIPAYLDLKQSNCTAQQSLDTSNNLPVQCGLGTRQETAAFVIFLWSLLSIILD